MTRSIALLAGLVTACTMTTELDAVEEVDKMDEAFLGADGKSDTSGISDDMAEARGILLLLNSADDDSLTDALTWPVNSIDNILAYRLGDDGVPGTADDRRFSNLAELDAIPFVGPRTFARMLAYVQTTGVAGPVRFDDVHPFTLSWPADGGGVSPDRWIPELSRLRLHIDKAANGAVQLSFVGDAGTWFVFQGQMSATGHVDATIVQNPLQALSDARVHLDPIYPDRFCASFTGSINLGTGAVPFTLPLAAKVGADVQLSCP